MSQLRSPWPVFSITTGMTAARGSYGSWLELARCMAPHLLAFAFPAYALVFLLTGPHEGWSTLLFIVPLLAHATADLYSPPLRRQPRAGLPSWPFDALLYALVALQLVNMWLLASLFAVQSFWSLDTLVAIARVAAPEDRSAARDLLDRLFGAEPDSTATIAVMHLLEGHTHQEVADAVGLSVSGVRKRLRKLRGLLDQLEGATG